MTNHKINELEMIKMIDVMHRVKLPHVKVMNVLWESVGFSENLNISECDIQNRYRTIW